MKIIVLLFFLLTASCCPEESIMDSSSETTLFNHLPTGEELGRLQDLSGKTTLKIEEKGKYYILTTTRDFPQKASYRNAMLSKDDLEQALERELLIFIKRIEELNIYEVILMKIEFPKRGKEKK